MTESVPENQPEPVPMTEEQREAALTIPVVQEFRRVCLNGLAHSRIDPGVVTVTMSMQGVFIGALSKLLCQYTQDGKPITMADVHRANREALEQAIADLQKPRIQVAGGPLKAN